MNHLWANRILRSRYLVATIAGFLWTGAFPELGVAGLAWVAPGLLVAAALGKRRGESFRIGYVGGLVHYLSLLYWLLLIPYRWHGLPLGPAAGWVALGAFLALFPAAWVWLVNSVPSPQAKAQSSETSPRPGDTTVGTAEGTGVLSRSWLRRTLWAAAGGAVWVALEMVLARVFGGFPWELLGASQYPLVPLIQVAAVTGVYGLSFLAVWVSLSLLSAGLTIVRRPGRSSAWIGEVFLPVLVVALIFNAGLRHVRQKTEAGRTLKITLIQPSIPQTVIWDDSEGARRFEQLVRWSDQALTNQTDLLIWPESAVPEMVRYDTNTFDAIADLARRHHVWMIIGSDDKEPRAGISGADEVAYFNSSFLVGPDGRLRERYLKRNLVIFGEYIPFKHWLPFLKYFTPITGGYTPGIRAEQFDLAGFGAKTSVLICFEDVFPQLGRGGVEPDTDFLVNITNDGWFEDSAAQWQHATSALFRAVENGVPLVRCTNNGLTCWFDAQGNFGAILHDSRGTIYGPGALYVEIPIAPRGQGRGLTFYTRHGDWFGWSCVGLTGLWVVGRLRLNPKAEIRNPKEGRTPKAE